MPHGAAQRLASLGVGERRRSPLSARRRHHQSRAERARATILPLPPHSPLTDLPASRPPAGRPCTPARHLPLSSPVELQLTQAQVGAAQRRAFGFGPDSRFVWPSGPSSVGGAQRGHTVGAQSLSGTGEHHVGCRAVSWPVTLPVSDGSAMQGAVTTTGAWDRVTLHTRLH